MENRVIIYFKKPPVLDRFLIGDRYLKKLKNLLYPPKVGSLELVFLNLCKGMSKIGIPFKKNLPFSHLKPTDRIIVLGTGKHVLKGYNKPNKIIAGIGLMTHPAQWPTLFEDYPIAVYLQHSKWTAAIYNNYYGVGSCKIWPVGIDTDYWKSNLKSPKTQVLIYVKFLWNKTENQKELLQSIHSYLDEQEIAYKVITYGNYQRKEYKEQLEKSWGMIFLCEHESQGIAYQEAMAMNVPILAWDGGRWLDPMRIGWGEPEFVKASSVPYFDTTCGEKFENLKEFISGFMHFYVNAKNNRYHPRNYIINHLSLEKSATLMLNIINEVYADDQQIP